jgi:serine/threonine-protein kinase
MGYVELVERREGRFRRLYARKRLHAPFRRDPGFLTMFMDEARIAGLIRHPNVVSVLDVGEDEQGPYLLMDYVEGVSLADLLDFCAREGRRIPLQVCLRIAGAVARGLHAAHELRSEDGALLGVVHRDVSPRNVLVAFDGAVRVLDFGIAKALGNASRTMSGVLKGSLGYMSPEQLRFQSLDRRSDLFALGVTLFELVAGRRLYKGRDDAEVARLILDEAPPDLGEEREDVPPALVELAFDLLAKAPEHRPDDAGAVAARLEAILAPMVDAEGVLEVSDYVRASLPALKAQAERRRQEATASATALLQATPVAPLSGAPAAGARGRRRLVGGAAALVAVVLVGAGGFAWRAASPPVGPAPEPRADVWAGGWHTCALDGGRLQCWGKNNEGQLGIGYTADQRGPREVPLPDVARVGAGHFHTCACTKDGAVHCWGSNHHGQLGRPGKEPALKPALVPGVDRCRELTAGAEHTCVLREGGQVICWGRSDHGQVGHVPGPARAEPGVVPGLGPAVHLHAFRHRTCAVEETGRVLCWGPPKGDALEPGPAEGPIAPVPVGLPGAAVEVAVGGAFVCARRADGTVMCQGERPPMDTSGLTDVVRLTAGLYHACALRRDASVWCWGLDMFGQLGHGSKAPSERPVAVAGEHRYTAVTAGEVHTCARHVEGLLCWGHNGTGQLGDGTIRDKLQPASVMGFGGP